MSTLTRMGLGIGAIAVTVGLVAGVYVSAQNADGPRRAFAERRGGAGGPMGALGPMLAGHLNLTDAQKDQLKGIMDSHRDESKGLGDRAMKARQTLQTAVVADAVDQFGVVQSALLLTSSLLVTAAACYYATRPLMNNVEPGPLATAGA